ncbi:hypothetical protein AX15_000048 [Amanita polypyramis BW_CC]|nr:hypothetical protein AX15_000048 [Amanita polypyramis BW_CC]
MVTPYSVHVSDIASSTTQEKLHDFFSFCGKITSIEHKGQDATIHFEKVSSAKTAILLSGGTLDGSTLHVSADNLPPEEAEEKPRESEHPDQSEKPRAGIAAEYLAAGYKVSDHLIQGMIDFDAKQGISKRFLDYIHTLDTKVGERALGPEQTISGKLQATVQSASVQAKSIDQQRGYSKMAQDYYERGLSSPWGKKVKIFYTNTSKQVQDIHEEARRIVEQHKGQESGVSKAASSSGTPQPTTQDVPTAT